MLKGQRTNYKTSQHSDSDWERKLSTNSGRFRQGQATTVYNTLFWMIPDSKIPVNITTKKKVSTCVLMGKVRAPSGREDKWRRRERRWKPINNLQLWWLHHFWLEKKYTSWYFYSTNTFRQNYFYSVTYIQPWSHIYLKCTFKGEHQSRKAAAVLCLLGLAAV